MDKMVDASNKGGELDTFRGRRFVSPEENFDPLQRGEMFELGVNGFGIPLREQEFIQLKIEDRCSLRI